MKRVELKIENQVRNHELVKGAIYRWDSAIVEEKFHYIASYLEDVEDVEGVGGTAWVLINLENGNLHLEPKSKEDLECHMEKWGLYMVSEGIDINS